MYNLVAVFLGGGLGSLARFGIAEWVKLKFTTSFPLATFLSNLLSCGILALAILLIQVKVGNQSLFQLFLITGFCGGFSTFSTFSFETVELFKNGNPYIAIANIAISLLACISLIYFLLKNQ
jgi:CrcB protein